MISQKQARKEVDALPLNPAVPHGHEVGREKERRGEQGEDSGLDSDQGWKIAVGAGKNRRIVAQHHSVNVGGE